MKAHGGVADQSRENVMANDQIRSNEEARASIAFADAALNLAGHVVTDAHLRDLQWKTATGELTVEEAGSAGERYLYEKFGYSHE